VSKAIGAESTLPSVNTGTPDATGQVRTAVRGRTLVARGVRVEGRTVVAGGTLLRIATVLDDEFVEGPVVPSPSNFITALRRTALRPDILTFPQKIDEAEPKYPYPYEMDNAAVAATSNFDAWWAALPQESRKNVRRASKRGVEVRIAAFDDDFVRGVKAIYDEIPVRQGRKFWHYGKSLDEVRAENATYLERSELLGAYHDGELVGFMKFVYVDNAAIMMQILAKASHHDKRPMNALIAKAVEICHRKGIAYLCYGKFTYGNKTGSEIAEFKRRNGFAKMDFPRYYVPLTMVGRLAVRLRLYRGILGLLPSSVIALFGRIRAAMLDIGAKANLKKPAAVAVSVADQAD
jgi:hypothetical protein